MVFWQLKKSIFIDAFRSAKQTYLIYQFHDIRILDLIFEFVLKIQGVMKLWNKVWRLLLPQLPPHLHMSTLTTPATAMVQSRRKLKTLCLTLLHRIINNKLDEQYYCTIRITLLLSILKCIRCISMSVCV